MESCLIPDHNGVFIRSNFLRKLIQEEIDDVGVQTGTDQALAFACFRSNRSQDPQVLVLRLSYRGWSASFFRPNIRDRSLLAKAGLILEIDSKPFTGMSLWDLFQFCWQFLTENLLCRVIRFGMFWPWFQTRVPKFVQQRINGGQRPDDTEFLRKD